MSWYEKQLRESLGIQKKAAMHAEQLKKCYEPIQSVKTLPAPSRKPQESG